MAETLMRLESFPFDSRFDGYDDYGYPVFDRAVGARMLRDTFKEFFKNGVFPAPANALEISKGNGLSVNLKGGAFIINGAMAVIADGTNIVLADQPPRGIITYGIMLRFDENTEFRSCYIRVAVGEAGGAIPAPQESAGVKEYRLGYITVPNGAQDLSGATVNNEKGTEFCPYASPFEKIDLSAVVNDAKNSGNEALIALLAYFEEYRDIIDAALDGSAATHLQQQITELKKIVDNLDFDLTDEVDGTTIEYTAVSDGINPPKKLKVKDGGIATAKIANGAVTKPKLGSDVISYIDKLSPRYSLDAYTLDELDELFYSGKFNGNEFKHFLLDEIVVKMSGIGDVKCICIGVQEDTIASGTHAGKKAGVTLMALKTVGEFNTSDAAFNYTNGWTGSNARNALNSGTVWNSIAPEFKSHIKEVRKKSWKKRTKEVENTNDKLWNLNISEINLVYHGETDPTGNTIYSGIKALGGAAELPIISLSRDTEIQFRDSQAWNSADTLLYAKNWSTTSTQTNYTVDCYPCFCL